MSLRLPSSGRRAFLVGAVTAAALACGPAVAQSVDGYVELGAARTEDRTETVGFAAVETKADFLVRRVNVTFAQRLFPNLQLLLGGFFENDDRRETIAGFRVETEERRSRPFIRLRLNAPTVRAEVGFDRSDETFSAAGRTVRGVRDALSSSAGWFPDSSNFIQVRYDRRDDELRGFTVIRRNSASTSVDSSGRPTNWLTLRYRTSYDVVNQVSESARTETNSQDARVSFSKAFWNARLSIAADYNKTRFESRQRSPSGSDVDVRLFPSAGLSAIDDTPERDPLAVNQALVNGDRTGAAGINLGLQPGDTRRRNFGFDLGVAQRIGVFLVWVDRELRDEVVRAFSWEIWTSDDQDLWTFRRALATAPFGPFENRFELVFEAVSARYVKVVVRPLEATDPFAAEFPVIEVTELEGFERVPPEQASSSLTRSNDRAVLGTRVRLLENEQFFYDLSALRSTAGGSESDQSLVNGLSYTRAFSPIWSMTSRLANERYQAPNRPWRNSNVLSASLSATPTPTLSASFFVGGRKESLEQLERDSVNAILTTSAAVYQGVDISASVGQTRTEESTGRTTDGLLVNANATITPHPAFTLGLNLQDTSRTTSGGGLPEVEDPNQSFEVTVTLNPVPTFYLFGSHRIDRRTVVLPSEDPRRTANNYSLSWSPFPYGTLRFSFLWNETYDSLFDATTRIWSPSLRWNIRPGWWFDVSYRRTRNDSEVQKFDRSEAFVSLRVSF